MHFARFTNGSFQDRKLASSSEKKYLSLRFGVDQEEAAVALGLLAWRKSAFLVLMVMALAVIQCDIYRIYHNANEWVYQRENKDAPLYHGVSGFPPRDIMPDYVSKDAQIFLNLTKPNIWTTTQGLWRFETSDGRISDLCLYASNQVLPDSDSTTITGNPIVLKECSRESQWLHGSDKNLFLDNEQMMLRSKPGWWTTDTLVAPGKDLDKLARYFEYEGYCIESSVTISGEGQLATQDYKVSLSPCAGINSQRWQKLYVSDKVPAGIVHTPSNRLHALQSR